jgi:hypothetical protein
MAVILAVWIHPANLCTDFLHIFEPVHRMQDVQVAHSHAQFRNKKIGEINAQVADFNKNFIRQRNQDATTPCKEILFFPAFYREFSVQPQSNIRRNQGVYRHCRDAQILHSAFIGW